MQKHNYQKELDQLLSALPVFDGKAPALLLHSCCAPCSSYVLEYLSSYFEIWDLYYNPNISPEEEYTKRSLELERMIERMNPKYPIHFIEGTYDPRIFYDAVKGHEKDPEGSERCFICYEQRMREAAREAVQRGCQYFTTTLSISPLKNAQKINEIGEKLAEEYGVRHLPSDFKKKNGYRRSVELSREFGLYRQDYCGCIFSKAQREEEKRLREQEQTAADTSVI